MHDSKDKKSKAEKKQVTSQKSVSNEGPAILESEKEAIIQMWEGNEGSRKFIEIIPEGSDVEMEQALPSSRTAGREVLRWDQGQVNMVECGLRWAVEARRRGRRQQEKEQRRQEEEQRRQEEQGQKGEKVRFGEEQLEETRARSTRRTSGDGWR